MVRQNTELAQGAGGRNLVDHIIEHKPARRHHSESDFVSHLSQLSIDFFTWPALGRCHFLGFFYCLFDRPDHVERLLGDIVMFSFN